MKQTLLALAAITVVAASCTKEAPKADPSIEDMLRTGKWRISTSMVTMTGPNGKRQTINYGAYRKRCIVDNYLRFDSLTRGAVYNGGTSCSVADADSVGFTWELTNNGKQMKLYNFYLMIDSIGQQIVYNATDSVWNWTFDSAITGHTAIIPAGLQDMSQSSFTLAYSLPGIWLDTSGGNQATPKVKSDVYDFQIKYTNF